MQKTLLNRSVSSGLLAGALLLAALFALVLAPAARAEVTLSNMFGDGMVLQRDKPVKVWGWATPGEDLKVRFAGQTLDAEANKDGRWSATLESMPASFDPRELSVIGQSGTVTIKDVLVGEVWLCGGQSNMAWSLGSTLNADLELASADTPAIRYLRLEMVASHEVQRDVPLADGAGWRPCVPGSVKECTAVGYYFARRLHRQLKVPIGIIDNSWGGTMAQYWCSRASLERVGEMKPYLTFFDESAKAWGDGGGEAGALKRYEADVKQWEIDSKEAKQKGERAPGKPNAKNYEDPRTKRQPAGMYNTLVAPMSGLTIRGVLFYQGENNSFGEAWKPFVHTFPLLIKEWRATFGDGDLPFGIIQIAGWSNRRSMSYDQNHHTNVVREIQHKTWQSTANTGLIATYDANSDGNIHPRHKRPVGERSARWALSEVYGVKSDRGQPLEWRGPVYESHQVDGDKIVVQFDKATAGGLRLDRDDAVGFYIAGEDKVFHHAGARADGRSGTVTVWSSEVTKPVAVRYAISNLPVGSLMNSRELPAYPFRTDTWPIRPHHSTGSYQADQPNPVVEDQQGAAADSDTSDLCVNAAKPLKVFVLTGQSNMTGRGALGDLSKPADAQAATLARYIKQPENLDKFAFLYNGETKTETGWTLRDDVYISLGEWPHLEPGAAGYNAYNKHGKLGPYYGGRGSRGFGPELAIGHLLGDHYDETVVLIKIAYGGNSLAGNFRPPSSGGKLGDKYTKVVQTVKAAMENLPVIAPGYTEAQGYELVGLFWNQGLSDMNEPQASEYEANLVNLIKDLRKDLDAPQMLVSIGVTGNWGWDLKELREAPKITQAQRDAYVAGIQKITKAQLDIAKRTEFKGSVATAETRDFWRPRPEHGGRGTETHWMANGESYWLIGASMGKAMIGMLPTE